MIGAVTPVICDVPSASSVYRILQAKNFETPYVDVIRKPSAFMYPQYNCLQMCVVGGIYLLRVLFPMSRKVSGYQGRYITVCIV